MTSYPPIIFTDDAWAIGQIAPPISIEDLRRKVVESYADTNGAYWLSVGDHEVFFHETKLGEIFGQDTERLKSQTDSFVHSATPGVNERLAANIRTLIDQGGPLAIMAKLCRQADLSFVPRVRMNSHYTIDPQHPAYGRFRRDHPEYLIGRPGEALPENSIEWGIRTGLNYALAPVRNYMQGIICEVFEDFDVDGVELDFMRHSAFFRMEEAFGNCYLMTDLIQQVKTRLDQASTQRGKELLLAVRVPPTLADCRRTGLDVEHWIRSGLVDIVVVGGGFIPYETPVAEFVAAAAPTPCLVYGCIEATRYIDRLNLRALASRWWRDGADGIYLYNFFTMSRAWNRQTYAELSDPTALVHLDKRYAMDKAGPFSPTGGHSAAFRYASPETQLPLSLDPDFSGKGPYLQLDIADALADAAEKNLLGPCTLVLRLQHLDPTDRLHVQLNHQPLAWEEARLNFKGWKRQQIEPLFWASYPTHPIEVDQEGISVEFSLSAPPLRQGPNQVEIHLISPDNRQGPTPVLEGLEITITYQGQA